jgi:hypothetical protein
MGVNAKCGFGNILTGGGERELGETNAKLIVLKFAVVV